MEANLDKAVAIVLNFRTAKKTLTCLRALLDEGICSVILVDNSEDDDRTLVEMHEDLMMLKKVGMNVHILTNGSNQGFARGVNAGFLKSKELGFSFVFLLNSDAYMEKGSIKKMFELIVESDVVLPMTKNAPNRDIKSLMGFYHLPTAMLFSHAKKGCMPYASGCCLLIKSNNFETFILDEEFFFYGEDVEFGFRCRKLNLNVMECQDACVIHEIAGSAKKGSLFYEYHINRSHYTVAIKCAPNYFTKLIWCLNRVFILGARAAIRSIRFSSLLPMYGFLLASLDFVRGRTQSLTPPAHP